MWPPIITAIISFILTGLIGGRLLQKWQLRNWLNQQKFLGAEKDYIALQELFDDIVALSVLCR